MKNIDFNRLPEFTERLPEKFLAWLKPYDEKRPLITNPPLVLLLAEAIGSNPDTLSQWIYVGRDNLEKDRRFEYRNKMIKEGWLLLDADICQTAIEAGKKIELLAVVSSDWLSTQVTGLYRPKKTEGRYFLIAPRKRNRGYFLGSLTEGGHRDCFCKLA